MQYNRDVINKEGIIISKTKYKDNDCLVNVVNENEIFSFYAKGVLKNKSKNAPSLNELSYSKFSLLQYQNSNLLLLESSLVENYQSMESIDDMACLSIIKDLTNVFIKDSDATKSIYSYLINILKLIKELQFDPLTLTAIYFAKVLVVNGYQFNVNECSICGSKNGISGVSLLDGGFVCSKCFDPNKHIKLTKDEMLSLRYLFLVDESKLTYKQLDKAVLVTLFKIFNMYLKDVENVELNSVKFLLDVI